MNLDDLWKVPSFIDSEDNFNELKYLIEFINNEQSFSIMIDDTLLTLEKSYKNFSNLFSSGLPKMSSIKLNTLESQYFRSFLRNKISQSDLYESYSKQYSLLRNNYSNQLKENYKIKCKSFLNLLNNLHSNLLNPLNLLKKSIQGYPKYFNKIIQLLQNNLKITSVQEIQIQKALLNLENKMNKIQDYYNDYHKSYINYCNE